MEHIESRPSRAEGKYHHDIYLEVKCSSYVINRLVSCIKTSINEADILLLDSTDKKKDEKGSNSFQSIFRWVNWKYY